ncbi:MAG: hypothetical protein EOP84_21550 [Verrucomicrobiaceae bacterium]|nr:MAG: hypothetical protein EOP84_21550 [Verrucomicrobiaceae bacterium]
MRIVYLFQAFLGTVLLSSCGSHTPAISFFSPQAHDTLLEHAFKDRLKPEKIQVMEASSRRFDKATQSVAECYKHSMASKQLPPKEALVERDKFVEDRIQTARKQAMRNECDPALVTLAEGLHTLMDSASDEHTDSDGMPKVWNPWKPWRHSPVEWWGHETAHDITAGDYWSQYQLLNAAFDKAFKGTPSIEEVMK